MRSVAESGAVYNSRMFEEDRSLGIHNTRYAVEVLMDSVKGLDPGFDVSSRH